MDRPDVFTFCQPPTRLRSSSLLLGIVLCGVSVVWAEPIAKAVEKLPRLEVSDRLEVPPERLLRNVSDFYGVYERATGRKVGWMSASQKPAVLDGTPVIQFVNHSEFVIQVEGQVVKNTTVEEFAFERRKPHLLLKARYEEKLKTFRKSIHLRWRSGTDYDAEIVESNERRTQTVEGLDMQLADFTAPSSWASIPARQTGDCFSVIAFDFKDLKPFVERYKIMKACSSEAEGGGVGKLIDVECEDLKDHYSSLFTYDGGGKLRRALIAGATELRLEPAELARRLDKPTDIFADSLVPLDKPLGDRNRNLVRLRVRLTGSSVGGIPDTSCQKVETSQGGKIAVITVGHGVGVPQKATEDEQKACLEATAQLPIHDPRVRQLAAAATKGAKSPQEKVRQILAFVERYITDDYGAAPLSLLDLLKIRRGDCTEHAMLFNALTRASGIPCREASGFLYLGDARKAFGGHAWNEVVLDGVWHPIDPTWNEFELDAAHIHLSSGQSTLRDARFLSGGLKMELLECTRSAGK